jgi:hypothetical protein
MIHHRPKPVALEEEDSDLDIHRSDIPAADQRVDDLQLKTILNGCAVLSPFEHCCLNYLEQLNLYRN